MHWRGRFDSGTSFSPVWGFEKITLYLIIFYFLFLFKIFLSWVSAVRFRWDS